MNQDLEQSAFDVLSSPTVQKGVATVTIGTGLAAVLDWMPDVLAICAGIAVLILNYSLIRKNMAETRKFNLESDRLEAIEKNREEEIKELCKKGKPLRRKTDHFLIKKKEG